jgi:tRNA nucleotidyltransferase/poly(A) polymerase
MADYIYTMEIRLTPDQQRGVTLVQEVARAAELNIYLTGGTIRDIISGFPIRDLDLTLQGDPLKLHKEFEKAGAKIQGQDEDTKTLYLLLPGNVRAELSMARSERYEKTGKPPIITPATISEDLRRRDFTINAMALSLNPGSRGLLLDPFNGVADIEAKLLRILHNYAFLEDPSRLIRATRFAARFHWTIEERTQARYDAAKENNYIEHITHRAIGKEIERLAYEDDPLHILKALEKEGWLKILNPHWSAAKVDTGDLTQLMRMRQQMVEAGYAVDPAPAALYFLTSRLSNDDIASMQRLIPRKDLVEAWRHLGDDAKELAKRLSGKEAATPSRTWQLLSSARPESILFLELTTKQQGASQKIKNFFGKWRQVRQKLPLPEMAEMRITPSLPEYPKLEQQAFLLLLDGKLRSRTEIMNFLKPYSPPPPPPPPPPPKRGRAAKAAAATAGGSKPVETKKPIETKQALETKKKGKEAVAVPPPPPAAAKKAPGPEHKKPVGKPSKAAAQPAKNSKPAAKKPAGKKR